MQKIDLNQASRASVPFVDRRNEIMQLQRLHAQGKHVLILGPAGVGKTALVTHLQDKVDLLLCRHSEHLAPIFESLEAGLGLSGDGLTLLQRKRQVLSSLRHRKGAVVFDGVNWTTPRLSSLLECVMERVPVWICTRSEHSRDIGHFWPLLVRFERLELRPFHATETRAFVVGAIRVGLIQPGVLAIINWLHRRSNGSPLVLLQMFEELVRNKYDLSNPLALRRLDLDRPIHEVFPMVRTLGKTEELRG